MVNLKNLWTVLKKELKAYFDSSIAYIYIIVFILFYGALFMPQFFLIGQAQMRYFFDLLPIVLCVFIPTVTMRLWAEDRRGNTYELLLTFPMRPAEIVLGKFFASLVFYLCALAATLPIPIMIMALGSPDIGPIIGGYCGAVLLGVLFIALGIFISGLCKDQIVAFILGMIGCFGLFFAGLEFISSFIDGWIPGAGSLLSKSFGLMRHYDSFIRGIVDIRDCFYFLGGSAVFLILNGFYIEGRMRPRRRAIFSTAVGLCLVIIAAFNYVIFDIPIGRFDLTSSKIYTVSNISKDILKDLKAPVTVKFYISPPAKMPTPLKTLQQDVVDKLSELSEVSRGKLKYKVFHMEAAVAEPESGEESMEEQLRKKGVNPFEVQAIEADEVQVKRVYSAIALSYKEKQDEIIPQILPDNIYDLEYLLISRIYRLTMDKLPKIALMAPYSEEKVDPNAIAALRQMGLELPSSQRMDKYKLLPLMLDYEGYKFQRINLTEDEPLTDDVDTLIVVQPQSLNERQRFEINKFLVEGGSVFLAVQNYRFDYSPAGGGVGVIPNKLETEVNSLLKDWGVTVSEQIFMDENSRIINITAPGAGIFSAMRSMPVKAPIQAEIDHRGMNKDISITSALEPIFYIWGSALKIDETKIKDMNLEKHILLESSPDSWEVSSSGAMLTAKEVVPPPIKDRSSRVLSLLLRGQFKDAFAGRDVPAWPKESETVDESVEPAPQEKVILTPKPGQLLVVGCSAIFEEDFFNIKSHRSFFINAVDALSLGDDLIKVRGKSVVDKSLGRVSVAQKVIWRFFTIFFVPIIITIVGSIHLILRRRLKYKII